MDVRIQNVIFWLLGLLMIIFGLNKFLGFITVDPPADETAQQFLTALFGSYLFGLVAIVEIVGGLFLLVSRTRFLGWLLLAPVVFNIVVFHLAHDFIGNGIWLLPSLLYGLGGYYLKKEVLYFSTQTL
ncbi:MAG: DoxX family protein [Bacteroidota bacterium]